MASAQRLPYGHQTLLTHPPALTDAPYRWLDEEPPTLSSSTLTPIWTPPAHSSGGLALGQPADTPSTTPVPPYLSRTPPTRYAQLPLPAEMTMLQLMLEQGAYEEVNQQQANAILSECGLDDSTPDRNAQAVNTSASRECGLTASQLHLDSPQHSVTHDLLFNGNDVREDHRVTCPPPDQATLDRLTGVHGRPGDDKRATLPTITVPPYQINGYWRDGVVSGPAGGPAGWSEDLGVELAADSPAPSTGPAVTRNGRGPAYTPEELDMLEQSFAENTKPARKGPEIARLATECHRTEHQIYVWFQNRRKKAKPEAASQAGIVVIDPALLHAASPAS